jgi:hypothetical protein
LFLADELVEVLDSAGLPLKPRLRLTPSVVRVLVREDLVRAPRGRREWVSVRIRSGVATSAVYGCMRRGQPRDRVPVAFDSRTIRDGLAGPEHRFHADADHPYSQASGYGSGFDEPPAAS